MAARMSDFGNRRDRAMDMKGASQEEMLIRAALHLNGKVIGPALGVVIGMIIFVATNWLVIKGGDVVGPHMSLLGQFFIGYTVSFTGSIIGTLYGFLSGCVAGWLVAWLFNWVVDLKGQGQ